MTVNIFGNYELPLSDKERETLISFLGDIYEKDQKKQLAKLLKSGVIDCITLSTLYFKPDEIEELKSETGGRLKTLSIYLQKFFKMFPGLDNEDNWKTSILFDEDKVPYVSVNDWLSSVMAGKTDGIDFDVSKVNDEDWVAWFNSYKSAIPAMVNVTPEMKLLVEFNDKLNELNSEWQNIDYIEIIKEIVQAAKENKL